MSEAKCVCLSQGTICCPLHNPFQKRHAAPVSAPLDTQALLALPQDRYSLWLQHGKVVNCFTHGVGDPAIWDHDKHWENKGYSRAPLYTAEQMRDYARIHAAPYAERIAHLESEVQTASQDGRAYQRKVDEKIIAQRDERIAHLERELDHARGAYQGCANALVIANKALGEA